MANVNKSPIPLAQQQQLKQQGALIDRQQYNYQAANVVTMSTASPAKTGNGFLAATCKLFHISSSTAAMPNNSKLPSTTRFKSYNPTNHVGNSSSSSSSSSSPSHLNNYNNNKVTDKKLMIHRSGNDKLSPTSSLSTLIRKFNYENYNNILQQYQQTTGIKMNDLNYKSSNSSTLCEEDHSSVANNGHHHQIGGNSDNQYVQQTKIGRNGQSPRFGLSSSTSSINDFRVNHPRQPLNLDQLNNLADDKSNLSRINHHKHHNNFFEEVENRSRDSKRDIDSLRLVADGDKHSCRNDQNREVYSSNNNNDTKLNNNGNKENDKTNSGISNNNQNNINNCNKNKLLMDTTIIDSKVNNESRQQCNAKINQTTSQSTTNISNSISDQTLLELNNIKCRKGGLFYNYPPPKITYDGGSSRIKNEATTDNNHNNNNNNNNDINNSDNKTKVTNFTFDSTISTILDSHSSTLQKEETSNAAITKPGLDRITNSGHEVINKRLSQDSGKPSSGYNNDYKQINLIDSQEPQLQQDMKVSQPIKKTAVSDNKTGNITRSHTSNSIIYNFDNNSNNQQARATNSTNVLSNNRSYEQEATVSSSQWNQDKKDRLKEGEQQQSAHDRNIGLQEGNKLSSIRQFVDNIRVLTMEAEINGSLSLNNNNSAQTHSQLPRQRTGVDPMLLLSQDDGQWEEGFEDMSLCSDAMSMISASSEFEYYNIEDSLMIDMKRYKPEGADKNDARKGPQLKSQPGSSGISSANGKNKRLSFTKSKKTPTLITSSDKDDLLGDGKLAVNEDKSNHSSTGLNDNPFLVHKQGLQGQQQQQPRPANVQQPKKGDDRMPSFLNSPIAIPDLVPQVVSSADNRINQNQSRQQNQPRKSRATSSGSGGHSTSSSSNSTHSQVNANQKSQPSLSAIFNANKALSGSSRAPSQHQQQQISSNNSKSQVQHAQQSDSSQNNREKTKLPGLSYLNDDIKTVNHVNNQNSPPLALNALSDRRRTSPSSTTNNEDNNNRPLPLLRKDPHSNDIDKCKPPVAIVSASANDSRNVNNLLPLGNVRARIRKMESFSVAPPLADQMPWPTNGQEQQLLESQSSQNKASAPTISKGLVPHKQQHHNQIVPSKNSVPSKQALNNTNNQQSTNNHNNTRLPNYSQIPHAITTQNTSSISNLSSSAKLLMRTNNTNYNNNKTNSASDLHKTKPNPTTTTNHVTATGTTTYSSDNNISQSYHSKAIQHLANSKLATGMAPVNSSNQQSQIQRNTTSSSGPTGRNISHNMINHTNQSTNYYKSANNSNKKYTNNHLGAGGNREDAFRNVSNNQLNINSKKSSIW